MEEKKLQVYEVTKFVKTREGFETLGQSRVKFGTLEVRRDFYSQDGMTWMFCPDRCASLSWVRMEEVSKKIAELNKKLNN